MDSGRFGISEGAGEGERVVEDEFTCAGMLRGSLTSLHTTVERIFRVHFDIGTDQLSPSNDGQIWLKLRGLKSDVQAAKLFVKGIVNQEEQQEVSYPPTLQCVFSGARGLFMDCLIRTTSALIVVGSPGCLLLSGLMEPVVRAFSLITDLVEHSEATQAKRTEPGERCPGESLESRRAFKNLVEQWDDRHTLDLLVLPGSIKEILLELIKEARLGDNPGQLLTDAKPEDPWAKSVPSFGNSDTRWDTSLARDTFSSHYLNSFDDSFSVRGRPEGAEVNSKSPEELGEEEQPGAIMRGKEDGDEQSMEHSGRKEFWPLLNFFSAMGFTEDVVKRVLEKTGLPEPSQILDLVQQEQDRTDKELRTKEAERHHDVGAAKVAERNRPCETEHKEEEGKRLPMWTKRREPIDDDKGNWLTGGVGELKDDDFVFGVLKKAAASCGYDEKQVTEAYCMIPDKSMHDLLRELQKSDSKQGSSLKDVPREIDDVVVERQPLKVAKEKFNNRCVVVTENTNASDRKDVVPKRNVVKEEMIWRNVDRREQANHERVNGPKQQNNLSDILGPQFKNRPKNPPDNYAPVRPPSPRTRKQAFEQTNRKDWSPTRAQERRAAQAAMLVTGEQRFLEGLHARFQLKLTDSPEKPNLRAIVIDGSNVAMSHGLGQFFSCRGIALAVQHFWDRGHRHINVLVPQWRTKSDPRNKEQHYLNELKELGIVSLTPSRDIQGKRISSYDDRLILQLAEKNDGIIVTNDNLRDLAVESRAWTDIIKKRLLQYTFVGDLFMVPDDPLGRGGPHLDEFLAKEQSFSDTDGYIYENMASPFPPTETHQNGQTDLNYHRGRPPGAAQNWNRPRPGPGLEPGAARGPEETEYLKDRLCSVFPGKESLVTLLLQCNPRLRDINTLSSMLLEEN